MINNTADAGISQDIPNKASPDVPVEIPENILSDPALLFLYYRVEHILGIKAKSDALINLNEYLEKTCGSSFVKNPASYEYCLTSREQIFNISKFLTVNETYFFREGVHFELLSELLPEMTKQKNPLRVCSAASSIGCEAFSIAMLLDYSIKNGLDFDFTIDAFDVSNAAIETAINARYTANTIRCDGASWKHILDLYLIRENDEYTVSQEIRKKVRFFTHNIMRGLDRQYDIIFFRNALIYFSSKSRHDVINNLSESLVQDGLLFLGISETSSVKHPLLANRYSSNAFYFQKTVNPDYLWHFDSKKEQSSSGTRSHSTEHAAKKTAGCAAEELSSHDLSAAALPVKLIAERQPEAPINCPEIAEILKIEEGKPNAQEVCNLLTKEENTSLSSGQLAAAVIYCLNKEDFEEAGKILQFLEKQNSQAGTKFLRGEYFFLRGNNEEAEKFYQEASVKDKLFWPAFYRISVIASQGNKTRYEYKIKKAIESIGFAMDSESGKELNYECFMGGFSPDYFLRILERKLV